MLLLCFPLKNELFDLVAEDGEGTSSGVLESEVELVSMVRNEESVVKAELVRLLFFTLAGWSKVSKTGESG